MAKPAHIGRRCPDDLGAALARDPLDDGRRLRLERADDDRHAGLDDARLLERDLPQRGPEVQLMIERDRRDRRGDEVGGATTFVASSLPPSPTSRTATSTPARRNSSNATAVVTSKKVGCTSSPPSARRLSMASRTSATAATRASSADRPAVDDEPLGEIDQMRRRVPRRPVAGGAQRRVDHRRHRAFAVGAGDVHRPECPLGMAEPGDERGDVVEAELDAELLEAEKILQRIHGASRGSGARLLGASASRLRRRLGGDRRRRHRRDHGWASPSRP